MQKWWHPRIRSGVLLLATTRLQCSRDVAVHMICPRTNRLQSVAALMKLTALVMTVKPHLWRRKKKTLIACAQCRRCGAYQVVVAQCRKHSTAVPIHGEAAEPLLTSHRLSLLCCCHSRCPTTYFNAIVLASCDITVVSNSCRLISRYSF